MTGAELVQQEVRETPIGIHSEVEPEGPLPFSGTSPFLLPSLLRCPAHLALFLRPGYPRLRNRDVTIIMVKSHIIHFFGNF